MMLISFIGASLYYHLTLYLAAARSLEGEAVFPWASKYADSPSVEDRGRAQRMAVEQDQIKEGLKGLMQEEAYLKRSLDSLKDSGYKDIKDEHFKRFAENEFSNEPDWVYEMSALYLTEAPVFYIAPPSILPDQQLEADALVENVLVASGLEKKPVDVSKSPPDPFHITSVSMANTAIKSCKDEIEILSKKRDEISKRMREISTQMANNRTLFTEYKALRLELTECNHRMRDETLRLKKLEHVKESLMKEHGAGKDTQSEELDLEQRADDLKSEASHNDITGDL